MYEATFEISVDGLLTDLSRDYDAEIRLWCNDHSDLLNIQSPDLRNVREKLELEVDIQELIQEGDQLVAVTGSCLKGLEDTLLETHLAINGCLSLPPLTYLHGRKLAKVLSLDPSSLSKIYQDLAAETTVTVRSKREIQTLHPEIPIIGLEDVFPELTDRQFDAFRAAHDGGYYEIPRSVTTSEIADAIGVKRRTAEDHLRRAENKIVDTLAGHLSLLQQQS